MKRVLSIMLFITIGSSLFAAGESKGPHGMSSGSGRLPLDLKHKAQLVRVLEVNEKVHSAFYSYNGVSIEKSALELKKTISKVLHKKALATLKPAAKLLSSLKAKNKKAANNMSYHKVSLLLAKIVNTYDVGTNYNVYSCPMVKKTWIQNSKKMLRTHNPYAPEMPHCGGRDTDY